MHFRLKSKRPFIAEKAVEAEETYYNIIIIITASKYHATCYRGYMGESEDQSRLLPWGGKAEDEIISK